MERSTRSFLGASFTVTVQVTGSAPSAEAEMAAVPAATAVTVPSSPTAATPALPEVHVMPSAPVAVSFPVPPTVSSRAVWSRVRVTAGVLGSTSSVGFLGGSGRSSPGFPLPMRV